jgi:hypothetical protein
METVKQQYLELLNQKCAAVSQILTLTQQEQFTGEEENFEDESERFADLYEKREAIISRIRAIDDALSAKAYNGLAEDGEIGPAHRQAMEKLTSMATAIVALDKKNVAASEKLTGFLKGNLKQIREGRGTSNKYTEVYEESTSGFLFDSKN